MAPKKYNGRDAFINFEPSNCGGELLYDCSTEGIAILSLFILQEMLILELTAWFLSISLYNDCGLNTPKLLQTIMWILI